MCNSSSWLLSVFSRLLSHASLSSLRPRLLAFVAIRLRRASAIAAPSTSDDAERGFIVGVIDAVMRSCTESEFEPADSSKPISAEEEARAVDQWSQAVHDPAATTSKLPRALARHLVRQLMRAEVGRKPSSSPRTVVPG